MHRNIRLGRHVALFKTLKFVVSFVLHLLMSLRWLTEYKSLTRYHVYPRLKIVTETFPEKVQHKSATATCNCTTDMCATPFCVALFTL